MNRYKALLWIGITFATCFTIAYLDSLSVNATWDCYFECLHLHGKIAYVICVLCLIGAFLVGLIRKKR